MKAVADSVRIPLNCLEVTLEDKRFNCFSSCGVGLSYSGKRPHLVLPQKGGLFVCDQDCESTTHLCSLCSCS